MLREIIGKEAEDRRPTSMSLASPAATSPSPSVLRRLTAIAASQARVAGEKPRVHPNGFVQLDLEHDGTRVAKSRLHVWPDGQDIPRQAVSTTIHDHKFDMHSTVLRGVLYQQEHYVQLDPCMNPWTHEIYTARYPDGRKESVLSSTGVVVCVHGSRAAEVVAGDSYFQSRYIFHDTDWEGLTATLMTKVGEDPEHNPRVLVPIGQEPDNSFVRADVDEGLLWDYIERALTSA